MEVVLLNPDQLVLQFEATNIEDFDHLIWLEERLAEDLGRDVEIDGHDFGRGEFNIFILAREPVEVFERVKEPVGMHCRNETFRAGYRAAGQEAYIVLWPPELDKFEVA